MHMHSVPCQGTTTTADALVQNSPVDRSASGHLHTVKPESNALRAAGHSPWVTLGTIHRCGAWAGHACEPESFLWNTEGRRPALPGCYGRRRQGTGAAAGAQQRPHHCAGPHFGGLVDFDQFCGAASASRYAEQSLSKHRLHKHACMTAVLTCKRLC